MNARAAHNTGVAVFVLLGVVDVVGLAGIGQDGAPPVPVIVFAALLGAVTLVAALPAFNRRPAGVATLIGSRAVSALLGVPAYFVDDVPTWARVGVTVCIGFTVLGCWLMLTARQQTRLSRA